MKSYEEMAQSALNRGKAMRKTQAKRKQILVGVLSSLAVCCLVILLVFGIEKKEDSPHGFLSVTYKTDAGIFGELFRYIAGTQEPTNVDLSVLEPRMDFQNGCIHVVAKAVETYPGVYEWLYAHGGQQILEYRLLRMEVINPLESGLEGDFYYLLPKHLQGDLTKYDALLISMAQLPKNFVLRSGDELTAFAYLFADQLDTPEMGNMIAFTDGVFDESLWQEETWSAGYVYGKDQLDRNDEHLLVSRGSTLEEALLRRQAQVDKCGEWAKPKQVKLYDFQTEAARQAMEYLKPFENGIFFASRGGDLAEYSVRRYINGCSTNEWLKIDYDKETVRTSEYRFEDADLENLPDLSVYIKNLELSKLTPQHTDTEGKTLAYNSAWGWYEKTETGVYSVVQIAWRYFDQEEQPDEEVLYTAYYDETFILLDETGDRIVSREELVSLIGDSVRISDMEYGVGHEILRVYF